MKALLRLRPKVAKQHDYPRVAKRLYKYANYSDNELVFTFVLVETLAVCWLSSDLCLVITLGS